MKVKVYDEVAKVIFNIIDKDLFKDRVVFKAEMNKIRESKGIKLMLDFYKAFDFETYEEVLYISLNDSDYDTENETLKMMNANLRRIVKDNYSVKAKMSSIKTYDFSTLEKRLVDKLPEGTEVDVEIYFVFDGINGGSIVENNKMLLNTMLWPSNEENLHLIEGILLHEYHHIGLLHWLNKYDKNFNDYSDSAGLAKYLMLSIMSEGAATYFYNDGDDIYPLVVESHGEETAFSIREAMRNRGSNIENYMNELELDLIDILNYQENINELRPLINKYTFSSTGEPLDKSVGYHMCSVIEEELGLESLIECFKNPNDFVFKYNDALKENDKLGFSEAFIRAWTSLVS